MQLANTKVSWIKEKKRSKSHGDGKEKRPSGSSKKAGKMGAADMPPGPKVVPTDLEKPVLGRQVAVLWEVEKEGQVWFEATVLSGNMKNRTLRIQYKQDNSVENISIRQEEVCWLDCNPMQNAPGAPVQVRDLAEDIEGRSVAVFWLLDGGGGQWYDATVEGADKRSKKLRVRFTHASASLICSDLCWRREHTRPLQSSTLSLWLNLLAVSCFPATLLC